VQPKAKGSRRTTMCYAGADRKTLFITESYSGTLLKAAMPVAGKILFSHL
jgi:gluconolactonase